MGRTAYGVCPPFLAVHDSTTNNLHKSTESVLDFGHANPNHCYASPSSCLVLLNAEICFASVRLVHATEFDLWLLHLARNLSDCLSLQVHGVGPGPSWSLPFRAATSYYRSKPYPST